MGKYALTKASQSKTWKPVKQVLPKQDQFRSEYEYNLSMYGVPGVGSLYEARNKKLEYEENQRWWQDYARNAGFDTSKIRYPIRSGLYRGAYSPLGEAFEVTEAIMSLYGLNKIIRW